MKMFFPLAILALALVLIAPAEPVRAAPADERVEGSPLMDRLEELFVGYVFRRRNRKDPFSTPPRGETVIVTTPNVVEQLWAKENRLYRDAKAAAESSNPQAFRRLYNEFLQVREQLLEAGLDPFRRVEMARHYQELREISEQAGNPLQTAGVVLQNMEADMQQSVRGTTFNYDTFRVNQDRIAKMFENWIPSTPEDRDSMNMIQKRAGWFARRAQERSQLPIGRLSVQGVTIFHEANDDQKRRAIINGEDYPEGHYFHLGRHNVLVEMITPTYVRLRFNPRLITADEQEVPFDPAEYEPGQKLAGEYWDLEIISSGL